MSIKVKGEAIKEGSIPLSALSDEIKNKLSNDKYKKLDWYYHSDAGGYAAESQTNKIIINEKEYILTDETAGIPVNNKEYGFTYNSYNDIYYVIVYGAEEEDVDILTNNVFILNDASSAVTADWNAEEGENGYIKNRTHYYCNTVKFKYNGNDDLYETDYVLYDSGPIYIEDVYDWNKKYEIPIIEYSEDGMYGFDWSNALIIEFWDVYEEYYGEFKVGYDVDNTRVVAIYNTNEADVDYDSRIKNMNIFNVVQIKPEFIPNTIARKSDIQGFDPVVWKYICKPYIFNSDAFSNGETIPSELMENGKLKYKIPAMYRINLSNSYSDIDFSDIDQQYGEYTPSYVGDKVLYTAPLNNGFIVQITIAPSGQWGIEVTV